MRKRTRKKLLAPLVRQYRLEYTTIREDFHRTYDLTNRIYHALQSKKAKKTWNAICIISAIAFFITGVYYLPFSPFPNGFNAPLTNQFGYVEFSINYTMKSTEYTTLANLTVTLTPQVQIAGSHGFIQPALEILPSVVSALGIRTITVRPEGAFVYGGVGQLLGSFSNPCPDNPSLACIASVYAPVESEMNLDQSSQNPTIWLHVQDVDFTASGSYGVSMDIITQNTTYKFEASNLYTIYSPDFLSVRYNEALTTSLTAFVLVFAAIEARPKD